MVFAVVFFTLTKLSITVMDKGYFRRKKTGASERSRQFLIFKMNVRDDYNRKRANLQNE